MFWLFAVFFLFDVEARAGAIDGVIDQDDRLEVSDPSVDPLLREAAASVAVLMSRYRLVATSGEPRRMRILCQTYRDRYYLCEDERFAPQPAPGYCTGFLAASDLLVTAGHCVRSAADCSNIAVVFGYALDEAEAYPEVVNESEIYYCRRIVSRDMDAGQGIDVTVLRLDRPVVGRFPLPLRREGEPAQRARVASIGHPSGLPAKVVTNGRLLGRQDGFYVTDLDSFSGSSGSPVIGLDSGLVEAMVVRGDTDFERTDEGCYRTRTCYSVEDCHPTEAVAASAILRHLPW